MLDKQTIISKLNLEPHPEGGFFKRTMTTGDDGTGRRLVSTCIYFLLEHGNPSSLHRIDADEYWMYHSGTSDIVIKGFSTNHNDAFVLPLGKQCAQWQRLIPRNTWFGAKTVSESKDAYALVSCICAPGFDFSGFSLGDRKTLIAEYPNHRRLIEEMCLREHQ